MPDLLHFQQSFSWQKYLFSPLSEFFLFNEYNPALLEHASLTHGISQLLCTLCMSKSEMAEMGQSWAR